MVAYIAIAIISYLIGSINFSVILSKKMAGFDIRKKGFKNYKSIVKGMVNFLANATYTKSGVQTSVYPKTPALYMQDLALSEMSVDLSNGLDGSLFNSTILSNNTNSGVSMQSFILNVKKQMLLQNMTLLFEFVDDSVVSMNLNLKVRFYDKTTNTLHQFGIGDFKINQGECDLVTGDSVELDFVSIAERVGITTKGFLLQPYNSVLNNGELIKNNAVEYHSEVINNLANYESCFNITESHSGDGAVSEYFDTTSSFFEIIFDAEKIDGVTPNYKVSFMSIDIASAS